MDAFGLLRLRHGAVHGGFVDALFEGPARPYACEPGFDGMLTRGPLAASPRCPAADPA